ncbi:hypothetical protein GCM10010468_70560 [Actinocorallia longicatena]|uniref:Uncharacterized protein n=2 Tax=Actinocorallia longicatena TaxID=111803 RepID=A0ABP6QJT5_9ACTN
MVEASWLGYARAVDDRSRESDAGGMAELECAQLHGDLEDDRRSILECWARIDEDWTRTLEAYRKSALEPAVASLYSAACGRVAGRKDHREESKRLATITADTAAYRRDYDVLELVLSTWKAARMSGAAPGVARKLAVKAARSHYRGKSVHDVSALPEPALTSWSGHSSPAAWADDEFLALWETTVGKWLDEVEAEAVGAAEAEGGRQLLLVRGWPLTHDRDADLAYLAAFPQLGAPVPDIARPIEIGFLQSSPAWAVVLAVPRLAAEHAAALPVPDECPARVVAGAEIKGNPSSESVDELLRLAYPYLPGDSAADGPNASPSAGVMAARAEYSSKVSENLAKAKAAGTDRLVEASAEGWRRGNRWSPPAGAPDSGARELVALLEALNFNVDVEIEVETGTPSEPGRHVLYGTITGLDQTKLDLDFTPAGHHRTIPVRLHRVISIAGCNYESGAVIWNEHGDRPRWESWKRVRW